jgi:putative endonuclease
MTEHPVKQPCVYILASQPQGTLYIGVTSNLVARLYQHRSGIVPGFTSANKVYRLVRYEKQLKNWHRPWKIKLIESENLDWADLAPGLGLEPVPFHVPKKRG